MKAYGYQLSPPRETLCLFAPRAASLRYSFVRCRCSSRWLNVTINESRFDRASEIASMARAAINMRLCRDYSFIG